MKLMCLVSILKIIADLRNRHAAVEWKINELIEVKLYDKSTAVKHGKISVNLISPRCD
jgi:hypothetical protein